jgi:hypothetical protein
VFVIPANTIPDGGSHIFTTNIRGTGTATLTVARPGPGLVEDPVTFNLGDEGEMAFHIPPGQRDVPWTFTITINSAVRDNIVIEGVSIKHAEVNTGSCIIPPGVLANALEQNFEWGPACELCPACYDCIKLCDCVFHTVTFNLGGGIYARSNQTLFSQTVLDGQNATALTQDPTKLGYVFAGWYPDLNLTNVTEDRAFEAQWIELYHTVTFDLDGGVYAGSNQALLEQIVRYGQNATALSQNPTRSRHKFNDWFEHPTEGTTAFDFDTMPITEDMTLYARWTFNGGSATNQGGSGSGATPPPEVVDSSEGIDSPDAIVLPEVPLGPFIGDHIWYVRGYPDGSFRPGQSITRAEIAMILWRLLDSDAKHVERGNDFTDVSTGWYARAASYLAFRGIVTGYEDGSFRPNNAITRAELTAMMSRFFEIDENGVNNFNDVSDTHWALAYINNAHDNGWVEGDGDGNFRPNAATSRAEAVTIINRVLGRIPDPETINYHLQNTLYEMTGETALFNDITNTHWAFYQVMEAAIEHDFDPDEQNREVWSDIRIPWLDIVTPSL